ncbi:Hypothetical predicted protein [Mytilus galloprovincialis]|uniref:Dynein heavy chain hydrolytic ATP-binding dynein motor region domain-containing protein n=1 Tax=Mytilus galloprovincialis TaxID=29158 RepID=A0A8B6DW16_MYTGA|nr:Hypothetical predicted protein [Mytilus galloprovincialis]
MLIYLSSWLKDVPLFKSILDDLFPGITPPDRDYGVLERAINMAIRDHGFQSWSNQVDKSNSSITK